MKTHLEKIDFLRGIAILLVFLYHASLVIFTGYREMVNYHGFWLDYHALSKINLILLCTPASFGDTGVTLFLIISGFLIHYGTLLKGNKPFRYLEFMNRRFWRIYPPYLFFLLILVYLTNTNSFLFSHLFLIHNLTDRDIFSVNPSFWSLALEFQLYIIYPVYLFLYRKFGNKKAFLIVVLVTLFTLWLRWYFDINSAAFNMSLPNYWIIWVSGAYLADSFYRKKRVANFKGYHLAALLIFIVFLRATILYQYFSFYLYCVFYVLLIDWMLREEVKLEGKWYLFLIKVGICSYSLYLFHQPYLFEMINVVRFGYYTFLITLPLCFLFLFFIAHLSYKYLELPSISLGKRFSSRNWQKTL